MEHAAIVRPAIEMIRFAFDETMRREDDRWALFQS
jgi:hypothetical protein